MHQPDPETSNESRFATTGTMSSPTPLLGRGHLAMLAALVGLVTGHRLKNPPESLVLFPPEGSPSPALKNR